MADVFISYAREDVASAQAIAEFLEGRGWSVWWDRDLIPGESFDQVIERELTAAAAVVVVWSKAAVDSPWVRSEANAAAEREVLVPVLVQTTEIPLRHRIVQRVDLRDWDGAPDDTRLLALIAGVRTLAGPPSPPVEPSSQLNQLVSPAPMALPPPLVPTMQPPAADDGATSSASTSSDVVPPAPVSVPARSRRRGPVVLLISAVTATALVVGIVSLRPGAPTSTTTTPGRATPDGRSGATDPGVEPVDPETVALNKLHSLLQEDLPTVDLLQEMWVPQLSSKRLGLEWEGVVFTYEEILRDHLELRERYGAVLVDGGGRYIFTTDGAQMVGWFITIVPRPEGDFPPVLSWCTEHGIDRDNCFAKYLTDEESEVRRSEFN